MGVVGTRVIKGKEFTDAYTNVNRVQIRGDQGLVDIQDFFDHASREESLSNGMPPERLPVQLTVETVRKIKELVYLDENVMKALPGEKV